MARGWGKRRRMHCTMKNLLVSIILAAGFSAAAAGLVTVECIPGVTNTIEIAEGESVRFVSHLTGGATGGGTIKAILRRGGVVVNLSGTLTQIHLTGPCRLELSGGIGPASLITFEVLPAPYPPDRAATIGPYSGDIRVTMEMSRDLVNWTQAENAAIYTNSPDARFFRIVIDKRVAP